MKFIIAPKKHAFSAQSRMRDADGSGNAMHELLGADWIGAVSPPHPAVRNKSVLLWSDHK
jgi:hypothetical protein